MVSQPYFATDIKSNTSFSTRTYATRNNRICNKSAPAASDNKFVIF
jgi:hypothetical protein